MLEPMKIWRDVFYPSMIAKHISTIRHALEQLARETEKTNFMNKKDGVCL